MADLTPSMLRQMLQDMGFDGEIATDTETSGLFADDGARVSTASVAFEAHGWSERADWQQYDNVTEGWETIASPDSGPVESYIVSMAWPFDQGTEGKPEDNGQPKLWPEAENLNSFQWRELLALLGTYDSVMHNSKFDSEKYRVGCRPWPGIGTELQHKVVWDTQNVNDLLWPLEPTSLKPTCARLFGKEWADEAGEVKKYLAKAKLPAGRWDLMPWDVIGKYADTDARITLMLKLRQVWEIEQRLVGRWLHYPDDAEQVGVRVTDGVHDAIERRLRTTEVLYHMERRGVPYDEVGSRESGIECLARAKRLADRLPFRPTTNEAKNYFFGSGVTSKGVECLDRVPYSVTDKGAPSLTAEIVTRMIEDRVEHADLWGEYSRVVNAASMWYNGYADAMGKDGRLRTSFKQNGTRSTRFSVQRVNLQAIPQDYRLSEHAALEGIPTPRNLIAGAVHSLSERSTTGGWRLYELDLEQAELRVGAMFAGCTSMLDMIANSVDLHTYTTKALFPDEDPDGPLFKSKWRQVGKRGNFSLQFGSGGKTFRQMVSKETGIRLTEKESNRIVEDWNDLYPEYRGAIAKHQKVVEKRQNQFGHAWIELIGGERRWFQPYEEAHKAFNQRVQGNLAQFGISWLLQTDPFLVGETELHERAEQDGIGEPGLVLTIHDSQVLLLPDDDYGRRLAAQCATFGTDLWKQMFSGVPGGVDYHQWDYVPAESE